MKVLIDVSTAPEHVVSWIASQLNAQVQPTPVAKKENPCKLVVTDVPEVEEVVPTRSEVLTAAKKFLDSKGVDDLKKVLTDLGIETVSKCPEGKLAALLATIAIEGE